MSPDCARRSRGLWEMLAFVVLTCGRIIWLPKASAGPTSAHRTDVGGSGAVSWFSGPRSSWLGKGEGGRASGSGGATRWLPDLGAQAPHESGQWQGPVSRRCRGRARSRAGLGAPCGAPLPPTQGARPALLGAAACRSSWGEPTCVSGPEHGDRRPRTCHVHLSGRAQAWPAWWADLSHAQLPVCPARRSHWAVCGGRRGTGLAQARAGGWAQALRRGQGMAIPRARPEARARVGTRSPASDSRLMPWTTASAGRADRAGEVGVQPSCSRGPGWGAAALPPPPPAQLPDGRRGPEPGVAGETGSSAPCPTEMPLFLAAQRLSDKVHVALRAVRQDNRPLRTTGPSAASPPRPSRLPGCPGKGPNQALRPAHRGPAGGRGAGTLESRCPPSHCMLGRASADAPHPRAQSGPGSGGIWGPRPLRGGPVGTGRLLPVKMLLIGGRETSPAWTSTHGADSQPGTAEWTRAPWLHVSTLSTEGGGGTEPHRPPGPLESCVHSAPPGTEPDGETLGGVGYCHAARGRATPPAGPTLSSTRCRRAPMVLLPRSLLFSVG